MPSKRKRIGYLPSINAQEKITKIANKEKLSQSKVVGILVEEALIARGSIDLKNSNNLNRKNLYSKRNNEDNSSFQDNDLDELISDKGIIFKTNAYNNNSKVIFPESKEDFNEELYKQFKQFILFQKMTQDETR